MKDKKTGKEKEESECGKGKSSGVTLLEVDIDVGPFKRKKVSGVE